MIRQKCLRNLWFSIGSRISESAQNVSSFRPPPAIMISPDGRIVWRGHPLGPIDGKDIKSRIVDALGKK